MQPRCQVCFRRSPRTTDVHDAEGATVLVCPTCFERYYAPRGQGVATPVAQDDVVQIRAILDAKGYREIGSVRVEHPIGTRIFTLWSNGVTHLLMDEDKPTDNDGHWCTMWQRLSATDTVADIMAAIP